MNKVPTEPRPVHVRIWLASVSKGPLADGS
jgi:hypothetical protein